jgi:hypothetical protein
VVGETVPDESEFTLLDICSSVDAADENMITYPA